MAKFNSESYAMAKDIGPTLMLTIVDSRTRMVRFSDVTRLDQVLRQLGFKLIKREQYGPPGGRQLFYRNGLIIVRLKTKGDAQGFRAHKPHLSAAVNDGQGLDWQNDRAKLSAHGKVEAKAMTTPENFKPVDFQGNPQRFVVILGGQYDGAGQQAWADRTHFPCPPGFSDAGVDSLPL